MMLPANMHSRLAFPPSGCWEWTGGNNGVGYGKTWQGGRMVYTHRVSYETFNGPLAAGKQIDHLCRNPKCCNPDHLDLTSARTNVMRSDSRGALNARATSCPQGHPYDEANTLRPSRGGRQCRACSRARKHAAAILKYANGPGRGANHRAKTECPHGHAYDEANTYRDPKGRRGCRACHRAREAARKLARSSGQAEREREVILAHKAKPENRERARRLERERQARLKRRMECKR